MKPGIRLGPYEILAPLGAGGMGEVYRARDTKLGREVAVKVLPEKLALDPASLARFEREARAVASLSHPNILAIHDFGREDVTAYAVMELLEGQTLRERLASGALPARKALDYAVQVAQGLAAAHEKGIAHRDLKPENLFITAEGRVKILDFGLAKVTMPEPEGTRVPTASAGTEPGVVMGTAGYMSPEQVRGQPVDHRSDIFSFGSVLYEMLTGQRAFRGDSPAETMAAIVQKEPPELSIADPALAPALDRLVRHCLEKSPSERFQSARDMAFDLQSVAGGWSGPQVAARPAPSRPGRKPLLVTAGALALALAWALGRFMTGGRAGDPDGRPVRFTVSLPAGAAYAPSEVSRGFSISPDGTRLGIEVFSRGRRHLYVRALDSEEAVELEGSLDASAHFWSPDSRFIAFYADGKLKKIPSTGGPPVELCDAPFALVGTWSRDGTILFSGLEPPGIFRVADSGGEAVSVTSPVRLENEVNHIWPHFLQDGRRFLYLVNANPGRAVQFRELRAASLDSKENRAVARLSSRVEYAPPGYLLYVRDSALFAQAFDERKAELHGSPQRLASGVYYFFGPSHAAFSVSQTGAIAYQTAAPPSRLAWLNRQGKEIGQLGQPAVIDGLRISPEGERVAVDIGDPRTGTSDVWVFDVPRGVATRLHSDPVDEALPVWAPDGSRLIYRSDRMGPPDIYEVALGTARGERTLLGGPGLEQPEDISPDGRLLMYGRYHTARDIWLLPLQGERKPFAWVQTRFDEANPRFSPDGRWIAFESDESGTPEVYAALTEGGGEKRRISPSGGTRPRWRRDGKELYYAAPGNSLMAVPVTPGARWAAGAPVPLFQTDTEIENYDVTPDGSRFLISMPLDRVRESPLRVILNWQAALEKEK
ncbi:MAG: protein kinase [Thermoanaerobaculia bacterium]